MPGGQLCPHEQAQPVGVGQVEVGRPGQLLIDLGQLAGLNAQAPVVDLDGEPVGHPLGPDLDPGARGREHCRVLDQLSQQVDHVRHGRGGHRVLGRGQHGYPLVVLDLGHGPADHVDHRYRLGPGPARCRAGQDGQALRVAAHPGGEVVQREQVAQRGRVRGLVFQRVDEAQLPLQQRLIPPGQADEHLPQPVPQAGLPGCRGDRGALQAGHGAHCLGDLGAPRLQPGHADIRGHGGLVSPPQLIQELRQLLARELLGRAGQAGDVTGDPAGKGAHQNDRDKDDDESRADQQR